MLEREKEVKANLARDTQALTKPNQVMHLRAYRSVDQKSVMCVDVDKSCFDIG
jgi:hypothetical protein